MRICVLGNFFIWWHKYTFEKLGIEYDVFDGFDLDTCNRINETNYDFVFITQTWANVSHPYERIKHKTVFWNTEDPNHFTRLARVALQCDYVFTTCSNCIPMYKKLSKLSKCDENNIHVMQFAMEPILHTGVAEEETEYDTVFIGNIYSDCQVRLDAEAALIWPIENQSQYDLHLWGHWETINGWEQTGINQKNHHGWVACDRVESVYCKAHIALSMNEQIDSPTMTSMRVYDIIGCGVPMISYKSEATENLFGEFVNFSETPEQTISILDRYFTDPKPFLEKAIEGREEAMKKHTYEHRIREMLDIVL